MTCQPPSVGFEVWYICGTSLQRGYIARSSKNHLTVDFKSCNSIPALAQSLRGVMFRCDCENVLELAVAEVGKQMSDSFILSDEELTDRIEIRIHNRFRERRMKSILDNWNKHREGCSVSVLFDEVVWFRSFGGPWHALADELEQMMLAKIATTPQLRFSPSDRSIASALSCLKLNDEIRHLLKRCIERQNTGQLWHCFGRDTEMDQFILELIPSAVRESWHRQLVLELSNPNISYQTMKKLCSFGDAIVDAVTGFIAITKEIDALTTAISVLSSIRSEKARQTLQVLSETERSELREALDYMPF